MVTLLWRDSWAHVNAKFYLIVTRFPRRQSKAAHLSPASCRGNEDGGCLRHPFCCAVCSVWWFSLFLTSLEETPRTISEEASPCTDLSWTETDEDPCDREHAILGARKGRRPDRYWDTTLTKPNDANHLLYTETTTSQSGASPGSFVNAS